VRLELLHYQPQQSVLKPQSGQRHTACMRYISACPQRSQIMRSPAGALVFSGETRRVIFRGSCGSGRVESGIAAIIADALTAPLAPPTQRKRNGWGAAHPR
jgi:hypothetical protein